MSGLCGWAGFTADEESRRRLLARMAEALSRHDRNQVDARCSVGCAVASTRGDAAVAEERSVLAAIAGRPVWHDKGLADLAAAKGHAHALAEAYSARGTKVLDVLGGPFALAVLREGEWEALLAVDRFATIPLDYAHRHKCLVFGTHGAALQAHPRAESEIDPQALYGYLFHGAVASPGTIRKHHRRLLPGHRLLLRDGKIEVEAYARQEWGEERRAAKEVEEEWRSLLRAGVEHAASGADAGVLSGGAGSVAVMGELAAVTGGPPRAYDGASSTPDDALDAIPRLAEAHGDPFSAELALEAWCAARAAAAEGVTRLLAGSSLLGSLPRCAEEAAVERAGRLPWLLRAVLAAVPGGPGRRVRAARTPLPGRLLAGSPLLRLGAKSVFHPEFLAGVDVEAPIRLVRHLWAASKAVDPLDRVLAHDLKFALADRDLPAVARSCQLAGIEAAFPLLSDDLAALEARLPAGLKAAFHRRLAGRGAPRAPLPLAGWMKGHRGLQQLAGDTLCALKARGIVRPAFVDEVVRRKAEGGDHGAMAFGLLFLELWFRAHEKAPATAK